MTIRMRVRLFAVVAVFSSAFIVAGSRQPMGRPIRSCRSC